MQKIRAQQERERIARERQERDRENARRGQQERERIAREQERECAIIIARLEEDIRQKEQREIATAARIVELEEEIREKERRELERERIAREQERESAIIIARLEEDIRQKEQREIATAIRLRELEEEIREGERREQEREIIAREQERESAIIIARLEEDIHQKEQIETVTTARVRELEEDIRQKEQRATVTTARIRKLEEDIREGEKIAIDQESERERIVASLIELEEDIRQREQREIVTAGRIRELEQERERTTVRLRKLEEEREQKEKVTTGRVRELETVIQKAEKLANLNPKQIKEIFKNDKIPVFKRYENQASELFDEFKNNKESKSMIAQHLEDLMIKGKISIGCSDCLLWPDVLDYVSMICEVEKLVADKVENQVKECYEGFSEWNDDLDTVKLTLIFNIFGLSPEIIEKFGPEVNGIRFDEDIFDVCSTCGIDDLETILDLGYIQMMLRTNNLPCSKHFETCPVCSCSTPKDLENLMGKHNLDFDFDLLERKNINGPRFIGNSRWVRICGERIDQKKFQKAFTTVKKLH